MSGEEQELKIKDRRHWVDETDSGEDVEVDLKPTYVAKLEKQMEENDARLKEYIGAYKEKMAENDQFRERLQKDVDRRVEARTAEFMRDILPAMDTLDLALGSARETNDIGRLIEGIELMRSGLVKTLERFGMEEIDCLDKPFDPAMSEAVGVIGVGEAAKDNMVLEVLQPGFVANEKLLRPAKVRVGRLENGG